MRRIGVLGQGFVEWAGGIDFLRMLMSSLHQVRPEMEMHVLVPEARNPKLFPRLLGQARVLLGGGRRRNSAPHPLQSHVDDLARDGEGRITIHRIPAGQIALRRKVAQLSLDLLLPAISPLPPRFPIPWIGYVFDFQHRYLPQLFTPEERQSRDLRFSQMLVNARTAIVNARTVARDAARFHPEGRAHIFALPFSASPQPSWFGSTDGVAARYGIQGRYFLICNQFWQHKDHRTAFQAFVRFASEHPDVDLVCTGATDDYRDSAYFPRLHQALHDDGVGDRVHILGLVPKIDQVALLRSALALIQPTLFEGGPGGGAVYDAVSLGVPCLVSDIEVNRELDEPLVSFFGSGIPEDLARSMVVIANQPPRSPADAEALLALGAARREKCGWRLLEVMDHALSGTAKAPR